MNSQTRPRLAFHCPCTLQHAQKLGGRVETVLTRLGFDLGAVPDSHLCCGSAGTYSLTQPEIAGRLRDRKMDALESSETGFDRHCQYGLWESLEWSGADGREALD